MISKLFAFPDDTLGSRSRGARERELQAYYDQHEQAVSKVSALKWLAAALLAFVGLAAWAGDNADAAEPNVQTEPDVNVRDDDGAMRGVVSRIPIDSPVSFFIDGPTGFVFVYTAEGWKFVRSMGSRKL